MIIIIQSQASVGGVSQRSDVIGRKWCVCVVTYPLIPYTGFAHKCHCIER